MSTLPFAFRMIAPLLLLWGCDEHALTLDDMDVYSDDDVAMEALRAAQHVNDPELRLIDCERHYFSITGPQGQSYPPELQDWILDLQEANPSHTTATTTNRDGTTTQTITASDSNDLTLPDTDGDGKGDGPPELDPPDDADWDVEEGHDPC